MAHVSNKCGACDRQIIWAIESFHRTRLALDAAETVVTDSLGWFQWSDITNLAGDSVRECWPETRIGATAHKKHVCKHS